MKPRTITVMWWPLHELPPNGWRAIQTLQCHHTTYSYLIERIASTRKTAPGGTRLSKKKGASPKSGSKRVASPRFAKQPGVGKVGVGKARTG